MTPPSLVLENLSVAKFHSLIYTVLFTDLDPIEIYTISTSNMINFTKH